MKTIFGMAKSFLDLGGCRHAKAELDLFKIAYALEFLKRRDQEGIGYMLVMTPSIKKTVEMWIRKYGFSGEIRVIVPEVTDVQRSTLSDEKARNKQGMMRGSAGENTDADSWATQGKMLGERCLLDTIRREHADIRTITSDFPLKIHWDYCGVVD
jgi:hypothetical protein